MLQTTIKENKVFKENNRGMTTKQGSMQELNEN